MTSSGAAGLPNTSPTPLEVQPARRATLVSAVARTAPARHARVCTCITTIPTTQPLLGKRKCEPSSGQNRGEDDATTSRARDPQGRVEGGQARKGRDAVRPFPRRPPSRGRLTGV